MAKVRVDGDQLYYELDVRENLANPDFFDIIVEAFVRDPRSRGPGNVTLSQVGDPVLMTSDLEAELVSILAQETGFNSNLAEFSNVVSRSGNGTHKYHYKFVSQYSFDFREGPPLSVGEMFGNSVFFTWPRTLELDITSFSQNQDRISEKVRNAAEAQGISIPAAVEIHQDTTSYSDVFIEAGRIAYIPFPFLLSEQLEAERDALIGEQGQSIPPVQDELSTSQITEEQRKSNLTLNEQAVLLFRVGELMETNKERRATPESTSKAFYDRFVCLDYKDPAEAANVANHVTSVTRLSPIFEELKPLHLSAMIPKIRLFKQYLPTDKKKRKDGDVPRTLVEFEFEEHAREDFLKRTLSTNTGVGVDSFEWHFNGENQYTAENHINATLRLRAQSIDALDEKRFSQTALDADGMPQQYSFTDLVIPRETKDQVEKKGNKTQEAITQRKQYEARVLVEYGVLNRKSEIWGRDDRLLKAIDDLRLEMNLTLSTHELDLQNDGTILVTCNFIGRIDAASTDDNYANILPTRNELEQMSDSTESRRKELLEERTEVLSFIESQEEQELALDESFLNALKQTQEQRELNPQELEALHRLSSTVAEMTADIQKRNLIYGKDLTDEEYLERVSLEFDKNLLYQNIINGLVRKNCVNTLRIDPDDITNETSTYDTTTRPESIVSAAAGEVANAKADNIIDMSRQRQDLVSILKSSVVPLYDNNNYYIKYFYYGDLVDVVLDGMLGSDRDMTNDIRTLLGPIEIEKNKLSSDTFSAQVAFKTSGKLSLVDLNGIKDPEKNKEAFKKTALEDTKKLIRQKTGTSENDEKVTIPKEKIVVNLADVPVSLNLFLSWFAENVANSGTYSYSLHKFMVHSINSLIVSCLQADSTKFILPKQKRKIISTPFEHHSPISSPDVFGFVHTMDEGLIVRPQPDGKPFIVEDKLTGRNGKAAALPVYIASNRTKDASRYMSDYLLVYAESLDYLRSFNGTSAEIKRDIESGIYHLHAGKDVGVVKEIKLSATNFPGYEEMMMLEGKKNGVPKQKRVYRANITLSGVPIFRPGHKIFINPAGYGTLSILRDYGLVGYYSVVTTSSTIEAGSYQTTLDCVFIGSGY